VKRGREELDPIQRTIARLCVDDRNDLHGPRVHNHDLIANHEVIKPTPTRLDCNDRVRNWNKVDRPGYGGTDRQIKVHAIKPRRAPLFDEDLMNLGSLLGGDVDRVALVRCCALPGGGTISIVVAPALLRGPILFEAPLFSRSVRCLVSLRAILRALIGLRFFALALGRLAGRFTISISRRRARAARLFLFAAFLGGVSRGPSSR
jgi:hypothetical protein